MAATTTCAGCGFEATALEGLTHADIGASPACWSVFARALVEDLTSPRDGHAAGLLDLARSQNTARHVDYCRRSRA
jgi:hypothetical protein